MQYCTENHKTWNYNKLQKSFSFSQKSNLQVTNELNFKM